MIPQASRRRRIAELMPTAKNVGWMLGGIALSTVVAVSAQQYAAAQQLSLQEQCDLQKEIEQVLNRQVAQIAATSPDPTKYFTVGGDSSCLGDISLANLDLSRLIPDPLGLLTDAVTGAVTKLQNAAVGKVCAAARSTFSDTITQYNAAIDASNSVDGVVKYKIDQAVTDQAQKAGASFGVDYKSASTTAPVDVLAGVQNKGSAVLAQMTNTASTATAAATQLTTTPTTVSPVSPVSNGQVDAPSASPQQVQPAAPTTVGSSIFGR